MNIIHFTTDRGINKIRKNTQKTAWMRVAHCCISFLFFYFSGKRHQCFFRIKYLRTKDLNHFRKLVFETIRCGCQIVRIYLYNTSRYLKRSMKLNSKRVVWWLIIIDRIICTLLSDCWKKKYTWKWFKDKLLNGIAKQCMTGFSSNMPILPNPLTNLTAA